MCIQNGNTEIQKQYKNRTVWGFFAHWDANMKKNGLSRKPVSNETYYGHNFLYLIKILLEK